MKNKRIFWALVCAGTISLCSFGAVSAFEGRGNLPIPGGSGGGGSGDEDHKLVWVHYSFIDGANGGKTGQPIWLVPQYVERDITKSYKCGTNWCTAEYPSQSTLKYAYNNVTVSGECAKKDVGFWALTLATNGARKADAYSDPNLPANAPNGSNSTQLTYLTSARSYPAWSDSVNTYMDGNAYMIYRNEYSTSKNGYAPYHTVSYNNANGTIKVHFGSIGLNAQTLYYYDGSKMYPMYTSDQIATSEQDIKDSYKLFYKKEYGKDITDAEVYTKMSEGGNGTYAFCSFGDDSLDNTIKSKTKISIDGTATSAESDWNSTKTNNDIYTTTSSTIKLSTTFTYNRDDTTVATSFNRTENVAGVSGAQTPTNGFGTGVSEIYSTYSSKEYALTYSADDYELICSDTTHSANITISGDSFTENSTEDSSACVKVKYVPLVATIQSKTKATVSVDGSVTSSESSIDNGDGSTEVGEVLDVAYGKNVAISWDHSLGVSSVKKITGDPVDPMEGSFNVRISNLSYGLNSSKTYKTLSSVSYNTGLNDWNVSGAGTNLVKSDDSTVKFNDSELVKLLPGDSRTLNKGIVHPDTVRNDASGTMSGSKSSSRKVTINAYNVKCNINGKDIGVYNADNYAKMTIATSNNAYSYRTVGDGTDDSGNNFAASEEVWLQPGNTMTISYDICAGAQIGYDKAWLSANPSTDWTNVMVGNIDTFAVTDAPVVNVLDNHLYKTGLNGTAPSASIKNSSTSGKSIAANEIGANAYLQARVDAGYQLSNQKTGMAKGSDQLGQSINNNISFRTSHDNAAAKSYSIKTNVPYNYIIDPGLDGSSEDAIYLGSTITAKSNYSVRPRVNEKVTKSTTTTYPTSVKDITRYYTAIFTLGEDKSLDDLLNGISASGATRIKDDSNNDTKDFYIRSDEADFGNILSGQIDGSIVASSTDKNAELEYEVSSGGIGTKYCSVSAVWPADSHNYLTQRESDAKILEGISQTNALSGDVPGTGAYWRYEINCQTIGKKPNMSVEGMGVITSGAVNTSHTRFDGNVFGSWSEYGLISAVNSNSVWFGSGASLAYHDPQSGKNVLSSPDKAGLENSNKCIGIQSVGNLDCRTNSNTAKIGINTNDASEYYQKSKDVRDRIIRRFNVSKNSGDYLIDSNIDKTGGSTKIIYADYINIAPDVTEINAILIADEHIDTCYDGTEKTEQGGTKGNSGLKDYCGNELTINGAVFAKNIKLDRSFGGGSYGDNLAAYSLIQRAEIFNYDPSFVYEAYQNSVENEPITTTYIKELPSRY